MNHSLCLLRTSQERLSAAQMTELVEWLSQDKGHHGQTADSGQAVDRGRYGYGEIFDRLPLLISLAPTRDLTLLVTSCQRII